DNPTWYQGTADAVRQSLRHIETFESDYVLILSGDQLYQMDFAEMLDNHKALGADISIATIPVMYKEASEFGILKSEDGMITSFIEKPKSDVLVDWVSDTGDEMKAVGRNYLASMGIYIFNRNLLFEMLRTEFDKATDFGKEIIPQSISKYKVASYQYSGYWTDIGNIRSFFEANLDLTKEIPDFDMFDMDRTIYTRPRMLPPAKISGTTLERTLIAEGCIIHASRIVHSVVGIRSRIGNGSTVENTYMMGSDYYETLADITSETEKGIPVVGVGERCHIKNAILDKNVRIGKDVRIIGGDHLENTDHALYTVKDGIVVIKKGAIIPDGFVI
ncbi:MAG: sugar phosphate nucleotidyltransferase, partial [Chitinophagaceae bacterium]